MAFTKVLSASAVILLALQPDSLLAQINGETQSGSPGIPFFGPMVTLAAKVVNATIHTDIEAKRAVGHAFATAASNVAGAAAQVGKGVLSGGAAATQIGGEIMGAGVNAMGNMIGIGAQIGDSIVPNNPISQMTGMAAEAVSTAGMASSVAGQVGSEIIKEGGGGGIDGIQNTFTSAMDVVKGGVDFASDVKSTFASTGTAMVENTAQPNRNV